MLLGHFPRPACNCCGLLALGRACACAAGLLAELPVRGLQGLGLRTRAGLPRGFFTFIFFISVFYKNIFSIWNFTKIYLGSRAAGAYPQKKTKKNYRQVSGDRSPGSGAAGPPGRLAAGRPAPPPYIKVLAAPHPPFGLLKIQKKRKEREG